MKKQDEWEDYVPPTDPSDLVANAAKFTLSDLQMLVDALDYEKLLASPISREMREFIRELIDQTMPSGGLVEGLAGPTPSGGLVEGLTGLAANSASDLVVTDWIAYESA